MRKTPRILVLHGFRMSGPMMREELTPLITSHHAAEWEFPDAPQPATGPTSRGISRKWPKLPTFEWWNARIAADGQWRYDGAEHSLEALCRLQRTGGQWDVVIGFSQGAMLAALVCGLVQTGRWPLATPWRSAMLISSGPPVRDPRFAESLTTPLRFASLHVFGGPRDITHREQREAARQWLATRRESLEHGSGHRVPPQGREDRVLGAMSRWLRARA